MTAGSLFKTSLKCGTSELYTQNILAHSRAIWGEDILKFFSYVSLSKIRPPGEANIAYMVISKLIGVN